MSRIAICLVVACLCTTTAHAGFGVGNPKPLNSETTRHLWWNRGEDRPASPTPGPCRPAPRPDFQGSDRGRENHPR